VEQVLRNHSETVGANQSTAVGANQSVAVGADQAVTVGAKRTVTVKKSEEITVSQGRTATIKDKDDSLTVTDGDWTVGVSTGNHTRTVKLTDKTTSKDFEADASNSVTISGDVKVFVHQKGAACTMEGEKVTIQAPDTIVINCASGAAFIKDNKMVLQGTEELVLQCGASKISLKKDGTIAIEGGKLVTAKVSDSTVKLEPAKAALAGPAVEVNGVGQTKIAGAIVKIN
jgi:type VI secretion system secreted protein VgrG